ncbi:MAG TPA: Crp/Fnr family transcriptional regulator [Candidatus Saccharimonadales bacterium]|nr:Crp/Fnr family transcriptional regulator [Candidatus Saccharimonadales bacterium]
MQSVQEATFAALFQNARHHTRNRGCILIHADEMPRGVFFLRRGYVKTYDITTEGTFQLIAITGPSEIFPLYWSFDTSTNDLFYEAMCEIEFSIVPRDTFRDQVMSDRRFLKLALATAMNSLRSSQKRMQSLQLPFARQRIAHQLLFFAEHYGKKIGSEFIIPMPLTYDDFAHTLNINRATVNREMLQLIEEELIMRESRHFIIKKPRALQAAAEGSLNRMFTAQAPA